MSCMGNKQRRIRNGVQNLQLFEHWCNVRRRGVLASSAHTQKHHIKQGVTCLISCLSLYPRDFWGFPPVAPVFSLPCSLGAGIQARLPALSRLPSRGGRDGSDLQSRGPAWWQTNKERLRRLCAALLTCNGTKNTILTTNHWLPKVFFFIATFWATLGCKSMCRKIKLFRCFVS